MIRATDDSGDVLEGLLDVQRDDEKMCRHSNISIFR